MLWECEVPTCPSVCTHRNSTHVTGETEYASFYTRSGYWFITTLLWGQFSRAINAHEAALRTELTLFLLHERIHTNCTSCKFFGKYGQVVHWKLSPHHNSSCPRLMSRPVVRADLKPHQVRGSMLSPSTYSPHIHPVPPITNSFCLSVPVEINGNKVKQCYWRKRTLK